MEGCEIARGDYLLLRFTYLLHMSCTRFTYFLLLVTTCYYMLLLFQHVFTTIFVLCLLYLLYLLYLTLRTFSSYSKDLLYLL